jgi:hypothetical protein
MRILHLTMSLKRCCGSVNPKIFLVKNVIIKTWACKHLHIDAQHWHQPYSLNLKDLKD